VNEEEEEIRSMVRASLSFLMISFSSSIPPPIIIINSFFFLLAVDTVVNIYIYIYKRRCEFALI